MVLPVPQRHIFGRRGDTLTGASCKEFEWIRNGSRMMTTLSALRSRR